MSHPRSMCMHSDTVSSNPLLLRQLFTSARCLPNSGEATSWPRRASSKTSYQSVLCISVGAQWTAPIQNQRWLVNFKSCVWHPLSYKWRRALSLLITMPRVCKKGTRQCFRLSLLLAKLNICGVARCIGFGRIRQALQSRRSQRCGKMEDECFQRSFWFSRIGSFKWSFSARDAAASQFTHPS